MRKHIVVVGGAGFIGSHLCDRLLADDRNFVLAIDNLCTGDACHISAAYNKRNFKFERMDASSSRTVDRVLELCNDRIDEIYYLASIASPKKYLAMPIETVQANVFGLYNFLELAADRLSKFLYTSTSEVYGDPEVMPQSEAYRGSVDPVSDRSVYDETKRVGETFVDVFRRKYGIETRIVRIFNTYGPRMTAGDGRVIPAFIGQALRGDDMTVYGDGSQTRSFCYVDDTVEGLLRVMSSSCFLPINIGNPTEYMTILDLAKQIRAIMSAESGISYREFFSQNDPKVRKPDISRAREVTEWEPTTGIDTGLKKTVEYFRDLAGASS